MSYWYTQFGTTTVGQCSPVHDISLPAKAQGIETISGAVDEWGSALAPVSLPYTITIRGEEVANTLATLGTKFQAIRALVGSRDKLYRSLDGTSGTQWAYARLVNMQASRDGNQQLAVPYTLRFLVYSPAWNGTSHTATAALGTEPTTEIAVYNAGDAPVRNAVLTITASTSDITDVTLAANGETSITWSGTLGGGNDLVIDCGAGSVTNSAADAYSGFSYGAGHTVSYWLSLGAEATTTLTITRTAASTGDVAGLVTVTYYDGYY
jgi:hypothetical protein